MNYRNIISQLLIAFIIFTSLSIISDALDCSNCHKTEPGKSSIKAKDTIEISDNTCLKCHNPEYPPKPIGYNTHLAHVGKYTVNTDYLKKHPKVAQSLTCDNCHKQIIDCKNCHVKDIPHIKPPLGDNCKGCHGELDKLFRHPDINLKIHDIFNLGNTAACTMCHNPDNMGSLKLASGESVSIQEPHRLCFQCHSNYYNLWDSGLHYSNKTIPSEEDLRASNEMGANIPEIRSGLEDKWRKENTCTNCHNPHNPAELYQIPNNEIEKMTETPIVSIIMQYYLYIIGTIILLIISIISIKNRDKFKRLTLPKALPKLQLPKISLPISISVEKSENIDKVEPEPVKNEKIEPIEKIEQKQIIKMKKFLRRSDILFILVLGVVLGSFYLIFGAFIPIAALVSESMSPHMEKGDIVFYTDISRINEIITYDKNGGYRSFEDYGYVIIYKPFGQDGVTPYIHRAMYYVEQGDEMWQGGPRAPHSGYITKGDNIETNPNYDQQISLSYLQPVKKEWIIGIARYRIPYIGYIRMILP